MSALPPKADMCGATRHVRYVPIADIGAPSQIFADTAESTLYAVKGRLMPLSLNSPTGSTLIASSTAIKTRGLMRICPGLASSQSRDATLDTVPMAA